MTTVEKLFVQIFERKNSIVQQVRRTADSFSQHLASKCLIEGITPPPWLWNPNVGSHVSDLKGLNKEELISELLLPQRQFKSTYPSGTCSILSKPIEAGDCGKSSDLLFGETQDPDNVNEAVDQTKHGPESCNNEEMCVFNYATRESSIKSPLGQPEMRISNINAAEDQSLARIQRSRSRQKALELRNSAQAVAKTRLSHETTSDVSPKERMLYGNTHLVSDYGDDLLKSVKPFGIGIDEKSSIMNEAEGGVCQSKENDKSICSGKLTMSGSSSKHLGSVDGSLALNCASDVSNRDGSIAGSKGKSRNIEHVDKDIEMDAVTAAETSVVRGEISDDQSYNIFSGEETKFRNSTHPDNSFNDFSKFDKSMQRPEDTNELPEVTGHLVVNKDTRSEVAHENNGASLCVIDSAILKSRTKITASDDQGISHGHENVAINDEGHVAGAVGLVQDESSNAQSIGFGPNLDCNHGKLLSGFIAGSSSVCSMFMKPKQLDFDEFEECQVDKSCSSTIENNTQDTELSNTKSNLQENSLSLQKQVSGTCNRSPVGNPPSERKVLRTVESGQKGLLGAAAEEHHHELELMEPGCNLYENESKRDIENILDAAVRRESCLPAHATDVASSNNINSANREMHELQCLSHENYAVEQQPDKGHVRRNRSTTISNTAEDKKLGLFHTSNFTKPKSQYIEDSMIEQLEMVDVSSAGGRRQNGEQHMEGISCLESEFHCGDLETSDCVDKTSEDITCLQEDSQLASVPSDSVHDEKQNVHSLKLKQIELTKESSLAERRFVTTKMVSWPGSKRRKLENRFSSCLSISPALEIQKLHSFRKNYTRRCLGINEDDADEIVSLLENSVSQERDIYDSNIKECTGTIFEQNLKCHLTKESDNSQRLPVQEMDDGIGTDFLFSEHLDSPDISRLATKETRDSHDVSLKEIVLADVSYNISDPRKSCDKQAFQQVLQPENPMCLINSDSFLNAEKDAWNTKFHLGEDNIPSNSKILSPPKINSDLTDLDQSKPMLEGFIIDPQSVCEESDMTVDGVNLSNLQRTSILEQICKSARMPTPFTQTSPAFKLHKTHHLHNSVPNGLLENMDQGCSLNNNFGEQHRPFNSRMNDINNWRTFSYHQPLSGTKYGWNSRNLSVSPVGKLWDRVSFTTSSSERQLSSNPELTCFTIEEDPSISEENENIDELTHQTSAETDAIETNNCGSGEPLADITEACSNPPAPVPMVKKSTSRGAMDSTNREDCFAATHSQIKQKPANCHSNRRKWTNEGKATSTLPIDASGAHKANKILHKRSSKPKLSGKTSLRKGVAALSGKENSHNIISNMTSFVPLVQQKQAAAACTGKRDVKVKALEAAEVAKRIEEKKENRRKMKKEALKLERARLERENLRQMEQQRKMKEDERKKKEADAAAKKRMREDEEKKEKEKKRKRIEARQQQSKQEEKRIEARLQQREQEDKLRAGKIEKEKQCGIMDGKATLGKISSNESVMHDISVKESGDADTLKKPENISMTSGVLKSDVKHISTVAKDSDDNRKIKKTSMVNMSMEIDDLATKSSREKSYDISPYQCSDEEEEEDDLPTKKFIPSWASSKNSVAQLLSTQQKIDPDRIFPQESFCSMDEANQMALQ